MASIRNNRSAGDRPAEDRYLDAARECILATGWTRTTLTDVARRAGVSRMTIYRSWPDMQTLLADLMTREWGAVVAAVASAGAGAAPLERLSLGVSRMVAALRANDLLRKIVEVDPELLLPYLLQRRGRSQDNILGIVAPLVAAGQEDGSVREGDPVLLARSIMLAALGFTLSAHTMADDEHPVDAYDEQLRVLLERYLTP
ncbi:TetR/AcrR family transcriptional regulator [Nocardioides pakistanensis]